MSLQQRVYDIIQKVPKGKVTTYGDIGKKLDTKGYRAIGQVLHKNPTWPKVPCHRVVMADGSLASNYGMGGPSVHRKRLEAEGVTFIGSKVDMDRYKAQL